jgi:acyl-[acyl-carrier-protein]-phospholipid O-acyltransferase/long-chain-fatty-acid--[acyl-carrier-protein] ligase
MVRTLYRIRVAHEERLPKKGGVLLLPNHVTYADAFFLSAACPRPVRFVMEEAFMRQRTIRVFTGIFDTMTIRRGHPLEAIRAIIHALQQGDVVCLFPEGQLTRTGTLSVLQNGFELIAKKTALPLIPVWCDGSWGSVFSFERNCFFRKIPHRLEYGMSVVFGHAILPHEANPPAVVDGMLSASAEAIGRRFLSRTWLTRMPRKKNPAAVTFRMADASARRRMWINGHQIGMINALQRRQPFHVLKDDPLLTALPGLFVAFPELFRATVCIEEAFHGDKDASWVGGDVLRNAMLDTPLTGALVFLDFGTRTLEPIERAGLCHCPCLAVDGTVVTMSMPHPPVASDNFEPQHGHKPHSWGKLLPGWHLQHAPDGTLLAHGPAAPGEGLPLPAGSTLDAEGFLIYC